MCFCKKILGEMKLIIELYKYIRNFLIRLKKDNISAFSAQAAFFLIMSIVPFFSLLLTLVKYLPISTNMLISTVQSFLPAVIKPMASLIIDELISKTNSAVLSVSVLVAIWSSSKGVMAIINGLKSVYHDEDNKNYILMRLISSFYTIVFVLAIIVTLLLIVFGNTIYSAMEKNIPAAAEFVGIFVREKFILSFCVLTLFFLFIYQLVKRKSTEFHYLIPGAIFSSLSWIIFSYGFSVYIDKFSDFSYTYGSLATIILLMLWVYICMYLLFIGAELNIEVQVWVDIVRKHIKKKKNNQN